MRFPRAQGLVCLILVAAACGNREERTRAPEPATVEGLGALPAESKILIGVNVARFADSTLVRRQIGRLLAEDPSLGTRVNALLEACKIDPAKDLETVHVGIVEDGKTYVMVVRGNLEEARLVGCIRESLSSSETTLETRMVSNAPAYVARDGAGTERGWFAFGGPRVLIVASTEAWLVRARDPSAPKVSGAGDMMGLVHRTDTKTALWAAGHLPERIAKAVVDVTSGIVKAPPTGAWGHFEAGHDGLDLEANLEMATPEDAVGLVGFGKKQLDYLDGIAQAQRIGPQVAKI